MTPTTPAMTVDEKPWYRSRVLVLNLVGLLVIVLGIIIENAAPLALPPQIVSYLGVLLAVCNAVLRFMPPAENTRPPAVTGG